jgi:hypothetical protein
MTDTPILMHLTYPEGGDAGSAELVRHQVSITTASFPLLMHIVEFLPGVPRGAIKRIQHLADGGWSGTF